MNYKLLVILGIVLVATSKHLHFTHSPQEYLHYQNDSPTDEQQQPQANPSGNEEAAPSESSASGSQQLFETLKANSAIAGLLNNSKASEADY